MPGYSSTISQVIRTYRWTDEYYRLILQSPRTPVSIMFKASKSSPPDFSQIAAAPVYFMGTPTPIAYQVDNWESLCH